MGKPTGFKEFSREIPKLRPAQERVRDWEEVYLDFPAEKLSTQGARCMDCGIPFCHWGCPLGNMAPEWNDLVYKGRWRDALKMLLKTNNFPEFTGRICPAPCEEACVLNVNGQPVTIRQIEVGIIDHAFQEGWVHPEPPADRTGKKVAIVGSGPAGLACAAQLNKAGHFVTVFERDNRIGGLLTYGIPNFKLEKQVVQRRLELMKEEGVHFLTNAHVGFNVSTERLRRDFDAICLCGGATQPRDLKAPGRELKGIHLAMEYLPLQNRANLGDSIADGQFISAKGKHVIILGGGDTGADCLGTAIRQGARTIHQYELLPMPPATRTADMPWPWWPMILRSSSSHEEGGERDWSINTKAFVGEKGAVKGLRAVRLEWKKEAKGRMEMKEITGSEFEIPCDFCVLALGFLRPDQKGPIEQLGVKIDDRGLVLTDDRFMTNVAGVFAAGDLRRGQSLVVWAIAEGRNAARGMDAFLMGKSDL